MSTRASSGAVGLALVFACAALQLDCASDRSTTSTASSGGAADTCDQTHVAYPGASGGARGMTVGSVLPDLTWSGLREDGSSGAISVHDYYEPCATRSRLLVLRTNGGAWCGTCLWHAAHTNELEALGIGARLRIVDLVVGDRDNMPATPADLPAWRALVTSTAPMAFGADPAFSLRGALGTPAVPVPLYVAVDTRTMGVKGVLSNPDPAALQSMLEKAIADADGTEPPAPPADPLVDGLFHRNEWDMLRDVTLPGAPPPDPTNASADDAKSAALGQSLFFDAGLSPSGEVSCASCHDPKHGLTYGQPQGTGVAKGTRKTPRIALASHARWQLWDGRADTLWGQALGPFETKAEFGSSRLFVVQRLASTYADAYAKAFPGSPLPDVSALPKSGMPGDPAFDALATADKDAVTRAFVNAGKAIAAYERTFRVKPSALDVYVGGDMTALTAVQKQGLYIFTSVGCMQCHHGPRLTDDAFHVNRVPTGRADLVADPGRRDGLSKLLASEFTGAGRFSDAPGTSHLPSAKADASATLGAFKTPSLRGVGDVAPFGHGGLEADLTAVTVLYGKGGLPEDDTRAVGAAEPWLMRFGETVQWSLVPFLKTLTAEPIVP